MLETIHPGLKQFIPVLWGRVFLRRWLCTRFLFLSFTLLQRRSTSTFSKKEALSKALGTGIGKDLSWQDMEILKNPLGKPEISLSPLVQERFDIGETFISLSHSATHAMAFCVIVRKNHTSHQ